MSEIDAIGVQIRNYKCFGEEPFGYEKILPVNLIIGRNHTGKSTLLDVIGYLTQPSDLSGLGHKGQTPRVMLSGTLGEKELERVFSRNSSGGGVPAGNHWSYGRRWVGRPVTWAVSHNGFDLVSVDPPFDSAVHRNFGPSLAKVIGNPFAAFKFKRLLADRDITAEPEDDQLTVESNGRGVTNAIRGHLIKSTLPSSLIEETVLNELNAIFEPDGKVTRILVQQLGGKGSLWELHFEEEDKGRVSLSHTGSGIKTILLVLSFLHLIPHIEGKPLTQYLFAFEELERRTLISGAASSSSASEVEERPAAD